MQAHRPPRPLSLERRIARVAVTVTLGVLLVFGAISFSLHYDLLSKHTRATGERALAIARVRIEGALTQAIRELESIAANPTTANALVDSIGRDAYLLPFLRSHWLSEAVGFGIALCDFAGKQVASSRATEDLCALVGKTLALPDLAEERSHIFEGPQGSMLAVALPVMFAGTGQTEGALVATFHLNELGRLASEGNDPAFHYHTAPATGSPGTPALDPQHGVGPNEINLAAHELTLPAPLAELRLTVHQVADRGHVLAPLNQLAWMYALAGLIATLVVAIWARAAARRAARPLTELADSARRLTTDLRSSLPTECTQIVEVQQLTRAIAAMVEALRASQAGLEERIAMRTAELQASEAHSRAILETALDSIITIDEAGCVTEFNPAAEHTFGLKREDVLGKSMVDIIVPPEHRAAHNEGMQRMVETGRSAILGRRIEVSALHANGERFPAELAVAPVRIGDRRFYTAYLRDITARKLAEASVREHVDRLHTVFSLSPDGFVVIDATGHIDYVNPAFMRMAALPETRLAGMPVAELDAYFASVRDPAETYPTLELAQPGEAPELLHLQRPNACILARSVRRDSAGRTILYFRDVTHEKEVERMKSEFLSTAAHELRTPLASIFGFTELLLARDYDAATRRELLGTINTQSRLLTGMINELLDLARIEARRGKDFQLRPENPQALVERTVGALLVPNDKRQIDVQILDKPPAVLIDPDKMQLALTNLLSNAYKYSPKGGDITLELAHAPASERPVRIRVRDQGIGMTPEQLSHATERFYRADTSGSIPGTGLGLALVREIVELHGGCLKLDSEYGHGTVATIELPEHPVPGVIAP